MWTCSKCGRVFKRTNQQHSCKLIPLEQHFKNKASTKLIYNFLLTQIHNEIGPYKIIPLPCCIHLYGNYDFIAILPHKDRLEIRFAIKKETTNQRIFNSVIINKNTVKVCININSIQEIDKELLGYIKQSYILKT